MMNLRTLLVLLALTVLQPGCCHWIHHHHHSFKPSSDAGSPLPPSLPPAPVR